MALTRPAPSARSYLRALPDRPMKTGATPTRLRPGVCRRAWSAQAAGAVATVVQFGHELAAAMCAPGGRGGGGGGGGGRGGGGRGGGWCSSVTNWPPQCAHRGCGSACPCRHGNGRSCWLRFLRVGKSPAAKCRRALARAAGDSQREMRIVVVGDGEKERGAGGGGIAEMAPNDPRRSFKKAIKPATWPDCSPVRRAMAMAIPSCSPSSRSLYRTPLRCMVLSERGIRATPCPSATRLKRIW